MIFVYFFSSFLVLLSPFGLNETGSQQDSCVIAYHWMEFDSFGDFLLVLMSHVPWFEWRAESNAKLFSLSNRILWSSKCVNAAIMNAITKNGYFFFLVR